MSKNKEELIALLYNKAVEKNIKLVIEYNNVLFIKLLSPLSPLSSILPHNPLSPN